METVAEITVTFRERALLLPQYVGNEEIKKTRYNDMLRDDIQEFVSMLSYKTMNDMIFGAHECEIEFELQTKCKP